MTFIPEHVLDFMKVFNASKQLIRNFEGCMHLELLADKDKPNILFTYSYWNSEKNLEHYRKSELFKTTWAQTKIHFESKAEAWSLERKERI